MPVPNRVAFPLSEGVRSRRTHQVATAGALVATAALGSGVTSAAAHPITTPGPVDAAAPVVQSGPASELETIDALLARGRRLASLTAPRWSQQGGSASAAGSVSFSLAIPAGPLASALALLTAATNTDVVADPSYLQDLTTDGVTGVFTPEEALDRLLRGTGLTFRRLPSGAVRLEIRLSDSVEIVGALPTVASAKYAAPLSQTPQTIHVISRAAFDEQGATTLTEALRNVPGITLQAGEGGGASNTSGDMFNMRGFSAANSLFVDGVRDDGLVARDVFNLEQVEVFSGPAGSDVGRSNAAGYVNLVTKSPMPGASRQAALAYATEANVRATFDVNQPLPLGERGTFLGGTAVRLNLLWQDGGVPGRGEVTRTSRALAPTLALGLNTATRVTLSGQVMSQDNLPDYGLPAAASPIGPLTPTGVVASEPVDQRNYFGSPEFDYDRVDQTSTTLRLERDVTRSTTLRNQTRYNKTERSALITSIGAYTPETNQVALLRQANVRENSVVSNHTSLTTRIRGAGLDHEVSVGLEIARERQYSPTMTGVGTRAAVDVNRPDVFSPVVGLDLQPTGASTEGETTTVALYAFDAFDIGRLRVTGGLRLEAYDTFSGAVAASGERTELRGEDTLVSGKVGLVYRLSAQGNVYASYGSSLTPPGSTNFQLNANPANQNNPNVDPQEATNIEVGTKWDLRGGRLQLNASAFRTENTNVIFVIDAAAVPPIYNQDDGQLVTGVAVSAVGRLTSFWDVSASYQHLRATLRTQNAANDGNWLTLTPERAGSVWTTFRLPLDLRVGGGFRYTDRVFVNAANTIVVPGYAVADLLFEAPVGDRVTLRLNVYNVSDRRYIKSINNNGARYNPGAPRSVLLTTGLRF